jgi:hypothetical protein
MRRTRRLVPKLLLAATTGLSLASAMATEDFSPYVDGQGNISFPTGFRSSMVHLGSWFVPEGGRISSDAGGLLLREVDLRLGLTARLAECFVDYRNPESI